MKKVLILCVAVLFTAFVSNAQHSSVKPIKDSITTTVTDGKTNVTYSNTLACLTKYSVSPADTVGKYKVEFNVSFFVNSVSRMEGYEPILNKQYKVVLNSYPLEAGVIANFRAISF